MDILTWLLLIVRRATEGIPALGSAVTARSTEVMPRADMEDSPDHRLNGGIWFLPTPICQLPSAQNQPNTIRCAVGSEIDLPPTP